MHELPEGKVVISWACGTGKTSAICRFIVEQIKNKKTGVLAVDRIDEVNELFYDIKSQFYYLTGKILENRDLIKLHSELGNDCITLEDVKNELNWYNWIICTHQRLFLEPSDLIFRKFNIQLGSKEHDCFPLRDYCLIDEYPRKLYDSIFLKDLVALLQFDRQAGIDAKLDRNERYNKRDSYFERIFRSEDPLEIGLLEQIEEIPYISKQRISKGKNLDQYRRKIKFFVDYYAEKLMKYKKDVPEKQRNKDDKLSYSLLDLPVKNLYFFDGTSDILFKESSKFQMVDHKFTRELNIKNIYKVHSEVVRKESNEKIVKGYAKILQQILLSHPEKEILVYTWKNSKKKDTNFRDSRQRLGEQIYSELHYPKNIKIISYMSGEERYTNAYSQAEILVILGSFYINSTELKELNRIFDSNISLEDFTETLIIQAIYRTSARKGKAIDIYFTDDIKDTLIQNVMKDCNVYEKEILVYNKYDIEKEKFIKKLVKYPHLKQVSKDEVQINNKELSEILNCKIDNSRIRKKLDKLGIVYEFILGKPHSPTLFKIFLNK